MCIKLSRPEAKKVKHMQLAISSADGFRTTSIDLTLQLAKLENPVKLWIRKKYVFRTLRFYDARCHRNNVETGSAIGQPSFLCRNSEGFEQLRGPKWLDIRVSYDGGCDQSPAEHVYNSLEFTWIHIAWWIYRVKWLFFCFLHRPAGENMTPCHRTRPPGWISSLTMPGS